MAYDMTGAMVEQTSPEDAFQLGLSAAVGLEADPDLVEAHKWFNIAAARGVMEARLRRQELSVLMSQAQIAAAQKAAREWLERAAN
jgi:uncharacterized protein